MTTQKRKFLIDTDTASDDAVAILMALEYPDVEVQCITIVAGNMPVEQGSTNALYTLELCKKSDKVPVYIGMTRPLSKTAQDAKWFHGSDGMGEMHYPDPDKSKIRKEHGVDMIIKTVLENPNEITIVTLGPLTNLGTAFRKEPKIIDLIKNIVVMGGAACCVGNVTPAAEYNIWCDPEAADIVFSSAKNGQITMVGWEMCRGEANLTQEEMDFCTNTIATKKAKFAIECNYHALRSSIEWLGDPGLGQPDPVAMAVALDPKNVIPKMSQHTVKIVTDGPARGMTIVDQLHVGASEPHIDPHWSHTGGKHLVNICWEINAKRWKEILYQCLRD